LVKGPATYLLKEQEELWNKLLPIEIENLLSGVGYIPTQMNEKGQLEYVYKQSVQRPKKYLAVTYKAPHNSAI